MSRTFGVEIECGSPWEFYYGDGDPDYCCRECSGEPPDHHEDAFANTERLLVTNGFPAWADDMGEDGTQLEIRSPILRGEAGLNELRAVLTLLNANGFYTTEEDGLHVHHGGEEFIGTENHHLVQRLVESWATNQDNIEAMVEERRRGPYWACEAWDLHKLERFREDIAAGRMGGYSRGNLNIDSLRTHGTIEIRQLEGTLDPDVAVAWVRFGQRFIETVLRREQPMTCADSVADFLNTLRVAPGARTTLLEKANYVEEVYA